MNRPTGALAILTLGCALALAAQPASDPQPPRQPASQTEATAAPEADEAPARPVRERVLAGLQRRLDETTRARELAERREAIIREAIARAEQGEGFDRALRLLRDDSFSRGQRRADEPAGGLAGTLDEPPLREHDPAAERERLITALDSVAPSLAQRLRMVSGDDRGKLDAALRMAGPRLRELIELHERDPQLAELKGVEMQTTLATWDAARELASIVRRDDAAERQISVARQTVRAAIGESLDARLAVRRLEADRLRARLEAFDTELARYESEREQQIERQLEIIEERAANSELLDPDRFDRVRRGRPLPRREQGRGGN